MCSVSGRSISRPGGDKEAKAAPERFDAKVPVSAAVERDQTGGGMKGEALGDQTVTSHKALFTKDTHTPASSQQRLCSPKSPTLPECQGRDLGDRANSSLRRRERETEPLNGTVCETPS